MDLNPATTSTQIDAPDADSVATELWPSGAFPVGVLRPRGGFQVICRRSVLNAIRTHGRSTIEVEVCGVLVGSVLQDADGPFLHVHETIRGEHASNLAAQVTFTADTWSHIQERMEAFPKARIVGWYHTHPDFGVFLSAPDRFIHDNFFSLPWQIALVDDPIRQDFGVFVWRRGEPVRESILVEEDVAEFDPMSPDIDLKTADGLSQGNSVPSAARPNSDLWLLVAAAVAIVAVTALVLMDWTELSSSVREALGWNVRQ
jgi:proteasome lid subunit RPN8/RPN11